MNSRSKSKQLLIILTPVVLSVMVLSISYASWRKTVTQEGLNKLDTLKCLSTTITDETSAINLDKEYPISNIEGMNKTPYKFKITNDCDIFINADIALEILSTTTLGQSYVRASLNQLGDKTDTSNILTNYTLGTATIGGATSRILKSNVQIFPKDSTIFDLRIWLDEATTTEQGANKIFNSKIVITVSPIVAPAHLIINLPNNPTGIYNSDFIGATWNNKRASLEISSLTSQNQTINLINQDTSGAVNLASYIISLVGINQGDGKLINEQAELFQKGTEKDDSYYTNTVNDPNYPFSWDNTNKTWTSSNKANSSVSTFIFKPNTSGLVAICYKISSEVTYDKATFYIDEIVKGIVSGSQNNCINLGNLTSSNTVKITYSKNNSTSINSDNVLFSINEGNLITRNAGYYYQGKNPHNWVIFNGEYWRIIGVFDSESHGKTGQNLVKIIREDSIGSLIMNTTASGNWNTSNLKTLLNTNYYNGVNENIVTNCYAYSQGKNFPGICNFKKDGITIKKYRDMIEKTVWKLGGFSTTQAPVGEFYIAERGTKVYSGMPLTGEGYIGLMYPSDYGYSVLESSCSRATNLEYYNQSVCGGQSWLYGKGSEWTITHNTSQISIFFNCYQNGYLSTSSLSRSNITRPVLYLKSNIKKTVGEGSLENPYIIVS